MIRFLLVGLMMAGTAASAQDAAPAAPTAAPAPSATVKPASGGDRMICEREEELGTRLGGHKVCKTASQWAEERRIQRAEIDRSQTQRSCYGTAGHC